MGSEKYLSQAYCSIFLLLIVLARTKAIPETSVSGNEKKYVLNIESCKCVPISGTCEVTISNRVFPDLKCQDNHQYCCQLAKKPQNTSFVKTAPTTTTTVVAPVARNKTSETRKPAMGLTKPAPPTTVAKNNITPEEKKAKIPLININTIRNMTKVNNNLYNNHRRNNNNLKNTTRLEPRVKFASFSPGINITSSQTKTSSSNTKPLPKISCSCQLKESCPANFTDSKSTFHCQHNKVRCCKPISEPLVPTSQDSSCLCLPRFRCRGSRGSAKVAPTIAKGPSASECPLMLVQCCGDAILKPKVKTQNSAPGKAEERSDQMEDIEEEEEVEENAEEYFDEDTNISAPANVNVNGKTEKDSQSEVLSQTTPSVMTPLQSQSIGQQQLGKLQPIQLPQLKIPLQSMEESSPPVETRTTTLPPPQLPTQYHYAPPNHDYRHLYTPSTQQIQHQHQPANHYFTTKNSEPWISSNSNNNHFNNHGYSDRSGSENDYFINGNGGRGLTPSTGFLNSLANFFG